MANGLLNGGGPGDGHRVLMIASAFPPTGGPGVQRTAKYAKYLPQSGWQPFAWTQEPVDELPQDPTLLADLPTEVRVYRHGNGGTIRAVRRSLRNVSDGDGLLSKLAKAVDWRLDARLATADSANDGSSWVRSSVAPVCRLIREENVAAIYSTFSPICNHTLALDVKRRTNLPWVADFRDLWTDDYRYDEPCEKRRGHHRRLELQILQTADIVIAVTERQTEILSGHLPPPQRSKFITITNGFDPADFTEKMPPRSADSRPFVLTHVGRFDRRRTPPAWFNGLRHFVDTLCEQKCRFELRIVGHVSAETRRRLDATKTPCSFAGEVPHAEAIREMRTADALLLNVPDGPNADSVIPAKLFEYLAAERPILVVGPEDGQAERIVNSCAAGITTNFDQDEIADALAQLMIGWHIGRPIPGCPAEALAPFSRLRLAQKLASVLNRLIGASRQKEEPAPKPVGAGMS